MLDILLKIILLLNAVWFGMAFDAFYRRRKVFGKVLVPKREDRDNTAYAALVESGRFMGGFNLALSVFNLLLLFITMPFMCTLFVVQTGHAVLRGGQLLLYFRLAGERLLQ